MNKDQVKGAMNDAAGRAKRQAGEWTGNVNTQAEGSAQQLKGKLQKALGNLKESAREAREEVRRESKINSGDAHTLDVEDIDETENETERDRRDAVTSRGHS